MDVEVAEADTSSWPLGSQSSELTGLWPGRLNTRAELVEGLRKEHISYDSFIRIS